MKVNENLIQGLPEGRNVVVVGLSRSGLAAAKALHRAGYTVQGSDGGSAPAAAEELRKLGIALELGGHTEATFLAADWLVLSPGVPPTIAALQAAVAATKPILGEMELAFRLAQAGGRDVPFVAITGTNGKSTTTQMVSKILETAGREHLLGGNIGDPLADRLDPAPPLVIAEVSSFQLEAIQTFRPRIGAILNLAPDHLDRYPDFQGYVEAKARMCLNMGDEDALLYNADDPLLRDLVLRWPDLIKLEFSRSRPVLNGAMSAEGYLCTVANGVRTRVLPVAELSVRGGHNVENALAAMAICQQLGVDPEAMADALRVYHPLPHRCEPAGTIKGVQFFDDSKGTNVGATLVTLAGFDERIILIAGGRAKGDDYTPLAEVLEKRRGHAILIGEAKEAMAQAFGSRITHQMAATLEEAAREALAQAQPGDVVVLSPACASYDMFRDYHHRGESFKQAVAALAAGLDPGRKDGPRP